MLGRNSVAWRQIAWRRRASLPRVWCAMSTRPASSAFPSSAAASPPARPVAVSTRWRRTSPVRIGDVEVNARRLRRRGFERGRVRAGVADRGGRSRRGRHRGARSRDGGAHREGRSHDRRDGRRLRTHAEEVTHRMIIDCHGHVSAPTELWAYKATLLAHRGSHGRGGVKVSDEELIAAANKAEHWPAGHLDLLKKHRTDRQLISPRPFQMMPVREAGQARALVHRGGEHAHPPAVPAPAGPLRADRRPAAGGGRTDPERLSRARALREARASRGACSIRIRTRTAAPRRRGSAIATGIRSTKSSASSTSPRTSTRRARAPSARRTRCTSSTRNRSRSSTW